MKSKECSEAPCSSSMRPDQLFASFPYGWVSDWGENHPKAQLSAWMETTSAPLLPITFAGSWSSVDHCLLGVGSWEGKPRMIPCPSPIASWEKGRSLAKKKSRVSRRRKKLARSCKRQEGCNKARAGNMAESVAVLWHQGSKGLMT